MGVTTPVFETEEGMAGENERLFTAAAIPSRKVRS
jgi:hypothetical protein